MTKKTKKKLLISSSILATSALSIGSIVVFHHYNSADISDTNKDKTDLFSQNNSINSRSLIGNDVEWGQLVNTDSSISLPDSIKINSQSPNAHVAVPDGIVLSTNKGICFLNQNTLKIDWIIDSIGNTNQTTIFSSIYFNNKVYTLHMYDGGMRVTEIDPTNGTITKQSKKLTCNRASNNDFSYVLLPVQETSDSIFIMPRGLMTNSERNVSTYQFWVNNDFDSSDNFKNINFEEDTTLSSSETKIVYSAGVAYTSSYGTFVARLERYSTSTRIFLRVYKTTTTNNANLWQEQELVNGSSINKDDYTDVTNHVAQINILTNSGLLDIQFILNYNSGSNSKVYGIYWNLNSSNLTTPQGNYSANLNNTGQDYDIEWGYWNSQIRKFCVLITHTNASEASFALISMGGLAGDNNFAPTNTKRINIYKPGSDDLFKKWDRKTGTFIPILTYGEEISNNILTGNQNFFVFNDLDDSNGKYIVYNGSPKNNDQTSYPYAYNIRITHANFNDLSDINLKDIADELNDDYVLNLLNDRRDFFIRNFLKFGREDTVWTISGVNQLTNEYIYQGKILVDEIYFGNYYYEGSLLNNLNMSHFWIKMNISGFHVWNTTQLATSITSDQQLENEINDPNHNDDLIFKNFIFRNKEQIFSDIPLESDFSLNNIIIKSCDDSKLKELTIEFALNSHIDNGELKSEETPFTLTITDILTTEQKITSIEADASLNIYTPQQIANDIGTSSKIITTLTNFIKTNKDEIFSNIPDDAEFAIDKDSQSSNIYGEVVEITNNSIKFKFSVRNIWINAVKKTEWNDKTIKNFEITLTGLKTQEATKGKGNAKINSGLNDILPVDWIANNNLTTQYLLDNLDKVFDNLPNKITDDREALLVSVDNIQIVGDPIPNNLDGTVTVTIKLNKYFDEQGMLYDGGSSFDNALEHTFKIIGFKSQQPTKIIKNSIVVTGVGKISASDWTEDVIQYIFDNKDKIFTNLPENFVQANIQIISKTPNNNNGEIAVEFYLNRYIDQKGNLVTNGDENGFKYTITLKGFKTDKPQNSNKWVAIVLILSGGVILLIISIYLILKYIKQRK